MLIHIHLSKLSQFYSKKNLCQFPHLHTFHISNLPFTKVYCYEDFEMEGVAEILSRDYTLSNGMSITVAAV